MTDSGRYQVEATKTSMRVMEALVGADEPLGVTGIAEQVDASKSVVHNHLSTLRERGYVVKRRGAYEPSLRPLALGNRTRARMPVFRKAKAKVDNLAEATGETTALFVTEACHGVPVYVADDTGGWSPEFHEGQRMPLHVNAPGKSILASFDDERVNDVLERTDLSQVTDLTVTDPDELCRQISRIRDDGISFCKGEQYEGIVSVAAPVPTQGDTRTAAIGVWGPSNRLSGRYLEEDVTGQILSTTKAVKVALTGE